MKKPIDPKSLRAFNEAIKKTKSKKKELPPPKKESSGDKDFDEAIELFLKKKK